MSNALVGRPMEILLIESNRDDVRLTREALLDTNIQHRLTIVRDGCEAMKFLHREDWFARAPTPDLILLDLSLPRKDGREILVELRADYEIKDVPIVILTTSRDEQDQVRGELFHVEGYLTKPVDIQRFVSLVKELRAYWHQDVVLPVSIWEH
jgi:CheY-like chemotaxis protein